MTVPHALEKLQNIKLTIEYEGTRYHGWQAQENCPSVQRELEGAISRVLDHPVVICGSGRTDRGVHALGQTASFQTPKTIPPEKVLLGINTYLPEDIRVLAVEYVPLDFHARYSAFGKRYRYTILISKVERVMARRFCEIIPGPIDVEAMRRGAEYLEGIHDFKAFEGNIKRREPLLGEPPRSTVRTLNGLVVQERGPLIFIDAFGRGFLYGMVRSIAGTLLEIGSGKRAPEEVEAILLSRDRRKAGFRAPARGLCLISVFYGEEALRKALQDCREGQESPDFSVGEQGIHLKYCFGMT